VIEAQWRLMMSESSDIPLIYIPCPDTDLLFTTFFVITELYCLSTISLHRVSNFLLKEVSSRLSLLCRLSARNTEEMVVVVGGSSSRIVPGGGKGHHYQNLENTTTMEFSHRRERELMPRDVVNSHQTQTPTVNNFRLQFRGHLGRARTIQK
jgi:hypothetical protein